MQRVIEIENIEEMRRREGIEDLELRKEIRQLSIGDFVKLTLLTGRTFETVLVRITSVRGQDFRGKLADKPASSDLARLRGGSPVSFTTAHIHSIAKVQPTH